jgi:hypothetical protein
MRRPLLRTSVRRISRRQRLRELIAVRGWLRIGEAQWNEILTTIPRLSPTDLQVLEIPVDPPWFGVRQDSLDRLETSLRELSEVYGTRPDLRRFCRDQVIGAKLRAQYASRNPRVDEIRRRAKAEMAEWMRVWLGDPALFPAWARLRREFLGTRLINNSGLVH